MCMYQSLIILLFSIFLQFLPLKNCYSQSFKEAKALIYRGYISNDQDLWAKGLTLFDANKPSASSKAYAYEYALAYYGKVGFCLENKSCKDIPDIVAKSEKALKDLLSQPEAPPKVKATLGGLYALKMQISPAMTMFLGPKSLGLIDEAIEQENPGPQAWVEKGNMRYHAPRLFGGNIPKAAKCFEKAIELFDTTPELRQDSWMYLHAHAWLGQAYQEMGNYSKALQAYQKALDFEPAFKWISNDLLPALKAKM